MRSAMSALFGLVLVAILVTAGFAEEEKYPWWKFGLVGSASETPAATASAPTQPPATPAAEESWFTWPTMPKLGRADAGSDGAASAIATPPAAKTATATQPRASRDDFGKLAHRTRPRNAWAQQAPVAAPAEPGPSPWQSFTNGTRKAWHKTVDFVTPGDNSETAVAQSEPRVSWWKRIWGTEDQTNEGPQTVTEWMAQERLDP